MAATNDNFASRITISGSSGSLSPAADLQTSNTIETGEPDTTFMKQTVWYEWTAPSSGTFRFNISPTLSAGRYAHVGVFTGTAVNALTPVAGSYAQHGSTVPLAFTAVSGTVYKIQVAVYNTPTVAGSVAMSWALVSPPANDNFANATVLTGTADADGPVDITAMTMEASEPDPSGIATGSVWYKWTAPSNMFLKVNISLGGTGGGPSIGIYTGASVGSLTPVKQALANSAVFEAISGTDYYIQYVNWVPSGDLEFSIEIVEAFPPSNDNFEDAHIVTPGEGFHDGTNVDASSDYPDAENYSSSSNVWYKLTAASDGIASFNTFYLPDEEGNIEDTTLTLYTGTDFDDLVYVDDNDDFSDDDNPNGLRSKLTFPVLEGVDYWIEVEDLGGGEGLFKLSWSVPEAAYETPFLTEWKIGVYDRGGNAQNSTSYDGETTDEFLKHVTDATWTIPLNGIDQLSFTIYLDDPAAVNIFKKQTFIRAWRFVNDVEAGKSRSPSWTAPDFCGVVTGITKSGEANTMKVTVMSVLWLVQNHFHLLNHRLVNDPSSVPSYRDGSNQTDLPWDHSALMFHLIDLINGAFKLTGGDTGIRRPPTADFPGTGYMSGYYLYWPQTIQVGPFYVQKGSYTWPYFYDDLLSREGSPDIIPEYINNGDFDTMYFRTGIIRGSDISADFSFDYRTGRKNLDDIEEEAQVIPGTQANLVWISGDGGPNTFVQDAIDDDDRAVNGLYMKHENIPGTKKADIDQIATDKLAVALKADAEIYSVTVSPAASDYYDIDYTVGDLVGLNADRGALLVESVKQRIYQVTLSWSDNNVETAEVMISADFKRKFPDA